MHRFCTFLFVAIALVAQPAAGDELPAKAVDDFRLADYRGKEHSLSDLKEKRLVVLAFLGTECPLAKLYAPRLAEMAKRYEASGVALVGINSNSQDSLTEISAYARKHGLEFPILKDVGGQLADQLGATRTPEVFVLDGERQVRYRGRIDDQYGVGVQRAKATRDDLVVALDELLAGQPVSEPHMPAMGCRIGRLREPVADHDITYSNQIARILQNRCVECHRPGQIAPFALMDYDEVAGWAEMIAEVVEERRMPPWHADPEHGHFANDARLPDDEREAILSWVRAGAPQGDPADLPAPREYPEGWRIPTPDAEVFMAEKPYQVPAEGEVKYQYFVVDPGFTEDRWIQAAECKPGNRAVVHHIIVGIKPPGAERATVHGEVASDWLVATAPGARPLVLPEGMAKLVPAGSQLVFQMHYTPNGTAQEDRSSVGLVFADPAKVKKEVGTWRASARSFEIPPGDANHRVEAWHTFGRDTLLLAMFPHMHLRGKSFRYEVEYPDGRGEVLLDVPHYDFNWQNGYQLAEPKRLSAGTKLHCVAHFDNSEQNLANPDPTATVRWGDQTWEEMMIGYFDMALADQDLTAGPRLTRTERFKQAVEKSTPVVSDRLREFAGKAFASHEGFERFGAELRTIVPQLDRVCLTVVEGGKLRIERSVHPDELRELDRLRKESYDATFLALARYAEGSETVVNPQISKLYTPDFKLLGRVFASSMHVPRKYQENPATLNFWSREGDAFPPEAVQVLEAVAKLVDSAE